MKPLKLSLLIAIAFTANNSFPKFFWIVPTSQDSLYKQAMTDPVLIRPYEAPINTQATDAKARFLAKEAFRFPEIMSALENNRPINFSNMTNDEKQSLLQDMDIHGLIDHEMIQKQPFIHHYKDMFKDLSNKQLQELRDRDNPYNFWDVLDFSMKSFNLVYEGALNSAKMVTGRRVNVLEKKGLDDYGVREKFTSLIKKLAKYDDIRNIIYSTYNLARSKSIEEHIDNGFTFAENINGLKKLDSKERLFKGKMDDKTSSNIEAIHFFYKLVKQFPKFIEIFPKITSHIDAEICEEMLDFSNSLSSFTSALLKDPISTRISGATGLARNVIDAVRLGYNFNDKITDIDRENREKIFGKIKNLQRQLTDYQNNDKLNFLLSDSTNRARFFLEEEKIKVEEDRRRWNKKVSDVTMTVINYGITEAKNRIDFAGNKINQIVEENKNKYAKFRNTISSEKPTPVIPPPVRDVPKQNTVNNQKPPVQEEPKHNDRGQDLTPDQGVATVQPPQGPTREYPVHQPSRPTSSNDDGVPPPQKAPNPNEHGVVSTGGGSNGLMPAPSPGRPTGGGDKLAPYQDEHAGNSSDPAYRPLPARPPKASDLAKAKELRERINRLNKMQDKLIYSFNAHKSQVESAIKENRVNDFIIDTAKLANSERKSALEIKEKVSDLEEEHEKITGSRNFRILYIDDPIDVDSLQNLISNQNKNRQTYQDLSEWGGVELDPEMASKLYSGDYLEKKYINGTPIKDFPTRGSAKYKGISDGKTVVKFQDTGEIHDSFQFHSDFGLEVNFERQTVTPSFSNIETYDHKNPSANTSWGIVNKNETYSDISISSFNGTAGFKGKATPQNCNQYCQDEEYQFVGAFSGPNAQQVSGIYQGKGKFKDSSNNSRDITSETMGIFGARRDNVHVPYVGLKDSSGIITSYDSLSEWGGITLNNDLKSKLPTNNYAGYNNFHATVENEIPKIGTADYYGSAQMQRINSQNKNVISQHTSDFEMSVNFQRQTVDSYFKNISPGAGLSHIDFEGVPIETYQHKILSDQQVTGFKRESKSAKIVGAFVGPKAEKTVGMFEVDVNQDAQLQGTFHGDKQ